ncbi:hypothetical protein NPIL_188381 [Nephila pilipes]|uniref:Uncharacterized protein n=1 Tax=Nephila pilipes TaxID=299642 RepID=A0A8X6PNG5_NEPPI|nr:hypothetical protein NPIL_188381 [Nephila pilipes]
MILPLPYICRALPSSPLCHAYSSRVGMYTYLPPRGVAALTNRRRGNMRAGTFCMGCTALMPAVCSAGGDDALLLVAARAYISALYAVPQRYIPLLTL